MNEALKCLKQAREVAVSYRAGQVTMKAEYEVEAAAATKEIARMDTRIKEIDAAIRQLSGK